MMMDIDLNELPPEEEDDDNSDPPCFVIGSHQPQTKEHSNERGNEASHELPPEEEDDDNSSPPNSAVENSNQQQTEDHSEGRENEASPVISVTDASNDGDIKDSKDMTKTGEIERMKEEVSINDANKTIATPSPAVFKPSIPGFVFVCNNRTKIHSFLYGVFGLPNNRIKDVEKIDSRTILFLYDCDSKHLHGVYIASARGGMALQPEAFGGNYPAQVKFRSYVTCRPMHESKFRHVMTYNHQESSKFRQQLTSSQVKQLIYLFTEHFVYWKT